MFACKHKIIDSSILSLKQICQMILGILWILTNSDNKRTISLYYLLYHMYQSVEMFALYS